MSSALVEMKELVVDRKRWYRGKGNIRSRLLRPEDNQMCCLGFYGLSCGLKEENIIDVGFPSQVRTGQRHGVDKSHKPVPLPKEMHWLEETISKQIGEDSSVFEEEVERTIGEINDNEEIDEETRERLLTEEFAKHNINVTFIN